MAKFLMVVPKPPEVTCGVWDYTSNVTRALRRRGHFVQGRIVGGKGRFRRSRFWLRRHPLRAPAIAKTRRSDYLVLQYEPWAYGALVHFLPLAAHFYGVRTLVVMHSVYFAGPDEKRTGLKSRVKLFLTRMLVRYAHVCFVSNRADEETLTVDILRRSESAAKVFRVPIGSNVPCLTPQESERSDPESLRICTMGINRPGKGLESLVAALALLADRDVDFHWTILGDWPDKEYRLGFDDLLREWDLKKRVRLTGRLGLEELGNELSSAQLGVFLENRGVTLKSTSLLAAYRCGLKCLCFVRRQGALEPLAPDPAIMEIDSANPAVVAEAIGRLAVRDARPSVESFDKVFGWDAIMRRWEEVLSKVG